MSWIEIHRDQRRAELFLTFSFFFPFAVFPLSHFEREFSSVNLSKCVESTPRSRILASLIGYYFLDSRFLWLNIIQSKSCRRKLQNTKIVVLSRHGLTQKGTKCRLFKAMSRTSYLSQRTSSRTSLREAWSVLYRTHHPNARRCHLITWCFVV